MQESIIKKLLISPISLAELLHLPKGVEVAAIGNTSFNGFAVTVVDPANKLPENCALDIVTKKWKKAPPKGRLFNPTLQKSQELRKSISKRK